MNPEHSAAAAARKEALRAQFLAYRRGLSAEAYAQRSAAIVARVQALPETERAQVVHLYWPLPDRREIDTRPLAAWLQAQGKQVVLPRVVRLTRGSTGTLPRMTHHRFTGEAALRPNRWGIQEPTDTPPLSLDQIDLVVVPALGAGRNGHRIGHGYGFYDEFLRLTAAPSICLVYEACLCDRVPAEEHDVPVSAIVTEQVVFRPDRT